METINVNDYFIESKKAIQLVLDREQELEKKIKSYDLLQLIKNQKEKAKTPEEYEFLEQEEKKLANKIRFNQLTEPAVPAEHREKIQRNLKVEELQRVEKLNELKGQLTEQIGYMKETLIPLLNSINELEAMEEVSNQIDIILDAEIGEKAVMPVSQRLKPFSKKEYRPRAGIALQDVQKAADELGKITVPIETTGLLSFLKRGKK
ncbi:hypothetical protein M3152_08355 [Sporosarcina luteola]|uniref:hypothetical protein n=1 Tax=Sporosarcina luteola TaxID=582850 RepID=UPI00203CEA7F|nr:hypothetical protein [Sporosarcina luteola]MCM3637732.1 hypothetical protein [Sporosarcina luteola]